MVAKGGEGKRREAKGSEGKRSIPGATRHRSRTGLPRALVRDDVSCQDRVPSRLLGSHARALACRASCAARSLCCCAARAASRCAWTARRRAASDGEVTRWGGERARSVCLEQPTTRRHEDTNLVGLTLRADELGFLRLRRDDDDGGDNGPQRLSLSGSKREEGAPRSRLKLH